jgi:ribosomal-protein-serine acetyltransferase
MNNSDYNIRLIKDEDAEQLFSLVTTNINRIKNYFPTTVKSITDNGTAVNYIAEKKRQAINRELFCFVIEDSEKQKIAGIIFIKSIDWNVCKAELGYFVDEKYAGKGIMSKSITKIIKYAFENLLLNKLYLRAALDNISSKKVAEKNGFEVEGILRKDFKTMDGTIIDLIYYGLLKKN